MSAPNPKDRTSRAPIVINGVSFSSYRVGTNKYALYTDDGRAYVARNFSAQTYRATVDGEPINGSGGKPKRFGSENAALAAAVKELQSK